MDEPLSVNPRFDALRNALYHTARRSFLDLINRSLSFLVIVLGTGVVSKIGDKSGFSSYLELGTVIVATLQLVFDFGSLARTHEFLQRRYYEVLSELEDRNIESDKDKLKYSAKLLLICSEEPMTMRALDAIAYNKGVDATISDSEQRKVYRLKVTLWQRLLRNVYAFHNVDFAPDDG
jgi:hypothetical protein